MNTTRLIAGTRRSFQVVGNLQAAFPTVPIFTTTQKDEQEDQSVLANNTILPPLPEVEVARPPDPPPDNFEGTVATGVSTLAADGTMHPPAQVMMNQPVSHATQREEAREFQIFMSNSEIAMRTAAGEENKLCRGGCYKFFPNDMDGRHTYSSCPFRRVDRVRELALPFLRRFRQQNAPLNRKVSSLLADPNKLTAAFCQSHHSTRGITVLVPSCQCKTISISCYALS